MEASDRERLAEFLHAPANSLCVDCDGECEADLFVSTQHATVICATCASLHRKFTISKAVPVGTLSEEEASALVLGGNDAFKSFLASPAQGVPRDEWLAVSLQVRYHTPAADLYRRRLAALSAASQVSSEASNVRFQRPSEVRPVESPPTPPAPAQGELTVRWTPDAVAFHCEVCRAHFKFYRRRHHCRMCGKCICADCSPPAQWRPLPHLGIEQHSRVCKQCVPPPRLGSWKIPKQPSVHSTRSAV